MIRGGIADKLGNRYEAKWLVRHFLDVIANNARWLKFEGVTPEYRGFEFAVERNGITEWHQTKETSPNGNWTINALKREGVLQAFSKRLSADKNAHCYFVSQDNAKVFRDIANKARLANSVEEYTRNVLSKDQKKEFEQLKTEWNQDENTVFDWLKRSYVIIIPKIEIGSFIESLGDQYFQNDGKTVFPNLRDILEENFNKTLSTEVAREAIKKQGVLQLKEWSFDPTIRERLREENDIYLKTYPSFGAGGEIILRDQSTVLLNEILKPGDPETILLTGVAGSGKSGVVRSVIEQLQKREVPHLAFRVDQHLSCSTKKEIGKKLMDREESPVTTLRGTFPDNLSVLFIDQVDAVSEVSGRDGQIKEVILRLITDAHNFGGVKIVVVCRTFDLENDPRLRDLKSKNHSVQIDIPLLDWKTEVEPLLKKKGVDASLLNEPQRQLLCLPINLAVFLEIDEPGFPFQSLSNLHERLFDKKKRIISRERNPQWALIQPIAALCDWMSNRQTLSAPVVVLDDFPNACDILTSEGLIVSSRGQVNFFHESFFDYIYARAFVKNQETLFDLLTSTEQHLFRRTQARQILEALRQNDFQRYLQELSAVLCSSDIRFHIKDAICRWLSTIDNPNKEEFSIILRFDEEKNKNYHQFFRNAVLSSLAWFDLLHKTNWIEQELESSSKERTERILRWLFNIAGERPSDIANLLRIWWNSDSDRASQLLEWFGFIKLRKPAEELGKLCEDIINSHPKDLFQHDRIMMLLDTWAEQSPEQCESILHSLFDAWFVLNPDHTPFEHNGLKKFDIHCLSKLSEKNPKIFLQVTTDALVRSIDMVIDKGKGNENWYHYQFRIYSGHRSGFDEFFGIFRSALKEVAKDAPETAISYLQKLKPHKHPCLMHLHLEAIQANPAELGDRLFPLVTDKMIFEAGYSGADWWSLAHACHTVFPYLDLEKKTLVEQAILKYTPEKDIAIQYLQKIKKEGESEPFFTLKSIIRDLNRSGYKQLNILETIGEELLTTTTQARLYELRRKFPEAQIEKPNCFEAYCVGSPIKRVHCEKMSDEQWLTAIEEYCSEERIRRGLNNIDGGARQLAGELQEATKKDPIRFSNLCLRIPDTANSSYIEGILGGLTAAENPSDEMLIQTVKRAHQHSEKPFGSGIARLIQKHPHIATNADILEIVIWYALHGNASESENFDEKNIETQTITIDSLLHRSNGLLVCGINGTRGQAWEALGSVLWKVPNGKEQIWEALEIALDKEALVSVRCCMMNSLGPLFNANKSRFTDAIRKLIVLPKCATYQHDSLCLTPLTTYESIHLFPYIFNSLPELADELVKQLLSSEDETQQIIGLWFIFGESFRGETIYIDLANKLASESVNHRRLLANVAADAIRWTDDKYRADALLRKFFFDEDEQVRDQAARVFSKLETEEIESYKDLAHEFLKSPAFPNNVFKIMQMLEDAICDVLDLVIESAQRITTDIAENSGQYKRHGYDGYQIPKLLKREYSSSESKPENRKKILDMIDRMLFSELYGVDSILKAHDRW